MILGRRAPRALYLRLRDLLWPRRGWLRAGRYVLARVRRMPGTPHSIAAGFASGAAVSFTPFLGGHLLLPFGLALLVRGNLVAAALGTAAGNPLTFPLMFAATYQLGSLILGEPARGFTDFSPLEPGEFLEEVGLRLRPMVVGSVPLGALVWVAVYLPLARAVAGVQERRHAGRSLRGPAVAGRSGIRPSA